MVCTQKSRLTGHFSQVKYVEGSDLASPEVRNAIHQFIERATVQYKQINTTKTNITNIVYVQAKDPDNCLPGHFSTFNGESNFVVFDVS